MSRTVERLVDLAAMLMLLSFCYLFRESQPALAGLVVGAAIQFWMSKNAASPDSPLHKEAAAAIEAAAAQATAAATAAAAVIRTADQVATGRRSVVSPGHAPEDEAR